MTRHRVQFIILIHQDFLNKSALIWHSGEEGSP